MIRCYLSPNEALMVESVVAALRDHLQGTGLLVAGYFNIDLAQPEGSIIKEDIEAALEIMGLEDIKAHFLLQ